MSEFKISIPRNSLKSIIVALLLFVSYTSFSQTIKTYTSPFILDVEGGINLPTNDFKNYAKNGYNVGLMLNKGVYKNLAVGLSAKYNSFGLEESSESPDNAWNSVSLGVGPQYTLAMRMFFIQLYGHIGMSWINTPAITQYAQGVDLSELGVFNLESSSTTGLHTDLGVKLGANLSRRISLFIGSAYTTNLNSPIKYNSRDLSKAIHESGEVYMDIVNTTPFEEKSLSLSSFNLNAGLSFNLGKSSAVRPAQDYNSSRSNKPSPVATPVDRVDTDSIPPPAQDYNSSRSNKPSPRVDLVDDIGNDDDEVIITGELSSISTASRQFELIDKNKQKINVIFQSEISDKEINDFKRKFENKKAMIHVKINRLQLNTGKQSINYELLEIEEIGK